MIDHKFRLIDPNPYRHYIDHYNRVYPETIVNAVADRNAWDWMAANVPFLDCPDPVIEQIYYFRWWVYRRHIRSTPGGYVISEFLPDVGHAGLYNTINCPVGHHFYEGRWIKTTQYLDDYARFMLYGGGDLHQYSCWFADAVEKHRWVTPDDAHAAGLLEGLYAYYRGWEEKQRGGLFYYTPWMDGMEYSVSGNLEERCRPTLNSYMFGDALSIASIAAAAGDASAAEAYRAKAAAIQQQVQETLWNPDLGFFATRDVEGRFTPADHPVREAVGFVPWYFNLPGPGFEAAWQQLADPRGFNTPVGLTSVEIRHPQFMKVNPERLASWDGAIWPYATSQTLTALQNLLRNYDQTFVSAVDFMRELHKYAASHRRAGLPSISEVLRDPYVPEMSGSEHYNHSTFCDLVITGAAGIVPRPDSILEVDPLFPEAWAYFCLDGATYRGHAITVAWDRDGSRYGAKGFQVLVDGEKLAESNRPQRVEIALRE